MTMIDDQKRHTPIPSRNPEVPPSTCSAANLLLPPSTEHPLGDFNPLIKCSLGPILWTHTHPLHPHTFITATSHYH